MEENRRKNQEEKTKKDIAQKKVSKPFWKGSFFYSIYCEHLLDVAQMMTFDLPVLRQ